MTETPTTIATPCVDEAGPLDNDKLCARTSHLDPRDVTNPAWQDALVVHRGNDIDVI